MLSLPVRDVTTLLIKMYHTTTALRYTDWSMQFQMQFNNNKCRFKHCGVFLWLGPPYPSRFKYFTINVFIWIFFLVWMRGKRKKTTTQNCPFCQHTRSPHTYKLSHMGAVQKNHHFLGSTLDQLAASLEHLGTLILCSGTLWSLSLRERRASHTPFCTRRCGDSNLCFISFLFFFSFLATFSGPRSLQLAACVLTGTVELWKWDGKLSVQNGYCFAERDIFDHRTKKKKGIHVLTLSFTCLLFIPYIHLDSWQVITWTFSSLRSSRPIRFVNASLTNLRPAFWCEGQH